MLEQEQTPVVVDNQPTEEQAPTNGAPPPETHTWMEEMEIAGSQLVERVKELIAEGNVRRLMISTAEGKVMLVPHRWCGCGRRCDDLCAGFSVGRSCCTTSPCKNYGLCVRRRNSPDFIR
ncbi:MAG: DUF4342 domain-containing protein [Caldilineaceae bacterium]